MDDLISRKDVLEVLGVPDFSDYKAVSNLMKIIALPAVEAVPLDKLYELSKEVGAGVPCLLCEKIMPEWCKSNNDPLPSVDAGFRCPSWKQLMTRYMDLLRTSK